LQWISFYGNKQAKAMVDKHETIAQFLMMTTDIDFETAKEDAAKMRYSLSDKIYTGIQNFIRQVEEYNK
jgi:Mn-dependent DtxR family transcriptional regulator